MHWVRHRFENPPAKPSQPVSAALPPPPLHPAPHAAAVTAGAFFGCIAPHLQPRYYSISSAPQQHPHSVHITCAVVREAMPSGARARLLPSTCIPHGRADTLRPCAESMRADVVILRRSAEGLLHYAALHRGNVQDGCTRASPPRGSRASARARQCRCSFGTRPSSCPPALPPRSSWWGQAQGSRPSGASCSSGPR